MYDGRCTYTHLLRAHIFCCAGCLRTSARSCVWTHTHGSSVKKKGVACVSYLSISPSPVSCLTHPCCSLILTSRPFLTLTSTRPCRTSYSQKRRACASPHEDEKFDCLAKSALNTGNGGGRNTRARGCSAGVRLKNLQNHTACTQLTQSDFRKLPTSSQVVLGNSPEPTTRGTHCKKWRPGGPVVRGRWSHHVSPDLGAVLLAVIRRRQCESWSRTKPTENGSHLPRERPGCSTS